MPQRNDSTRRASTNICDKHSISTATLLLAMTCWMGSAWALTGEEKAGLAMGENEQRIEVLNKVVAQGDIAAVPYLQQLLDDAVKIDGKNVLIVLDDGSATDAVTGEAVTPSDDVEDVVNNNRMGSELDASIAALNLLSKDEKVRLESAKALQGTEANASRLGLIQKVEQTETDGKIKDTLAMVRASIELTSEDKTMRLAAAEARLRTTIDLNRPVNVIMRDQRRAFHNFTGYQRCQRYHISLAVSHIKFFQVRQRRTISTICLRHHPEVAPVQIEIVYITATQKR